MAWFRVLVAEENEIVCWVGWVLERLEVVWWKSF